MNCDILKICLYKDVKVLNVNKNSSTKKRTYSASTLSHCHLEAMIFKNFKIDIFTCIKFETIRYLDLVLMAYKKKFTKHFHNFFISIFNQSFIISQYLTGL